MAILRDYLVELIELIDFEDDEIAKFYDENVLGEYKSQVTHRWCGSENVKRWWELDSGFIIGFIDLGDEADFVISKKKKHSIRGFNFINPKENNEIIDQTNGEKTALKMMRKYIKDGKNVYCIDKEGYRLHFINGDLKRSSFDVARKTTFKI